MTAGANGAVPYADLSRTPSDAFFARTQRCSGIAPGSPVLQADSLPAEPQGKPKNTASGGVRAPFWMQGPRDQESDVGLPSGSRLCPLC